MLHAKSDRLTYAELLAPPKDYKLIKAIGTTYSLDLYALLAIPVAMFYNQSLDGNFNVDRYDVLDALRQCEEKVTVFCQADKLKVPKEYKKIFVFLDKTVRLVNPSQLHASFHPKIWILRFENNKKEVKYRLAVLSRNLTFDQSWDISVFMDGEIKSKNQDATRLSKYVQSFYKDGMTKEEQGFFTDLEKVHFEVPNSFKSLEIFPILGFNNRIKEYPNPLEADGFEDLLVISPFLDKSTISKFTEKNISLTIFSRLEELQKLDQDFLRQNAHLISSYYLNTALVEGESYLDNEGEEVAQQNLHAKIFISQNKGISNWYLGSANFTNPAFTRNAELLIKLESDYRDSEFKHVLDALKDEKQRFFIAYSPIEEAIVDADKDKENLIRKLFFDLSNLNILGELREQSSGKFDVLLTIDMSLISLEHTELFVSPIHSKIQEPQILNFCKSNLVRFEDISITELSPFFVCTLLIDGEEKQLILKANIDLPEIRKDRIFQQLIGNKIRFLEYLQFLLSPSQENNKVGYSNSLADVLDSKQQTLASVLGLSNNLYESLLLTASRDRYKLKQIDGIVESLIRIDASIVEDFLPIWNVYKKMIHE